MAKFKQIIFGLSFFGLFLGAESVFAHVTVKPAEVGVGAWQTFTMSVPVEKEVPTVKLRLVIPDGLEYVTPNVKLGWKVNVKKDGEKVTEIYWEGGSIPAGMRDEFAFSAHVPASPSKIFWKAYQTYSNGSVVSWDQEPTAVETDDDSSDNGPYSVTNVIDDLKPVSVEKDDDRHEGKVLPVIAIAMSGIALAMQLFKKKA